MTIGSRDSGSIRNRGPRRRGLVAGSRAASLLGLLGCLLAGLDTGRGVALAEPIPPRVVLDPVGDWRICRVDPGTDGEIDLARHRMPDLLAYIIGRWKPDVPHLDLFTGQWDSVADFVRLDLVFNGVMNPPGTLGDEYPWDPFKYGPNPVFGFVEIDMDRDVSTGGEFSSPEVMFLGNAARFGGYPVGARFKNRLALDQSAFDGDLHTLPLVDRSGEDFHLALDGYLVNEAELQRSDTSDFVFGPGETWLVSGRFWHRTHGYEAVSHAACTRGYGIYEPYVTLQFKHDLATDRTTISLVAPLTNAAAFLAGQGNLLEPLDGECRNQASVLEGLDDLVFSARYADPRWLTLPEFQLINGWLAYGLYPQDENNVSQFLGPQQWEITVLVGGSYLYYEGDTSLVYSDISPDAKSGDFNGSGMVDQMDLKQLYQFISANDGQPGKDADGIVNNVVQLPNFGPNFSLYDTNYDGQVDFADRPALPVDACPGGCSRADFDQDGDVDQDDFQHLWEQCFTGEGLAPPADGCYDADLDHDFDVDQSDFGLFQLCLSGSGNVASPSCP